MISCLLTLLYMTNSLFMTGVLLNFNKLMVLLVYMLMFSFVSFLFFNWMGIILLLVYVGALLILFFYMISLTPKSLVLSGWFMSSMSDLLVPLLLMSLNWFSVVLYLIYDGLQQEVFLNPFFNWKFSFFISLYLIFILLVLSSIKLFNVGKFRLYF